ncbi:site-specific integrase [Georgenia satyanarayanai]|uniref:site-specific integrase n=1 Tax=Georgenia satyanarayanai TaxID=860221 RepID=UPI00204016C2|nr:phage integrase SAM-like domain-containing protein [Georgenia satyanarayanai]MCM3662007.1 site-specific integrase [Georgenia satyanarayanai]
MRAEAAAGTVAATTSPTVQEWLAWWLQHVAATRLKPSTYANYRSAIHRTLIPSIGHLRLDRLTTDDVEKMHAFVTSRGVGAATARYAHAALRKALHDAVARGRIRQNPAALIEAPPPQRTTRTALSVAEAQRILEVTAGDRLAARWALALVLGVRRGEAIGLALDSVEPDRAHISWQLQRLRMRHGCSPRPRVDGTWPCGLRRPGSCPLTTADIHNPELESRHLEGLFGLLVGSGTRGGS